MSFNDTMRNFFSKIKVILAAVLATFLLSSSCFAASNTIELKTDKTDLSAGDEITVSADLPDDAKIYALTATLQYDQNVFEPIAAANFDTSETTAVSYNPDNRQFGVINQTGAVDDNLLVFRLKVKNDASAGDTNLALTNISASDGQTKTQYNSASTKLLITRDATEGEVVPTSQENVIVEEVSEPENVFFSAPFIFAAIIMAGVIFLVGVLYFGNLTPHTSKLYYSLICLGVVIVVLSVAIGIVNRSKKDVNGDQQVGYSDAQSIVDYLINLQGTQSGDDQSENSDSTHNIGYQRGSNGYYATSASPTAASNVSPNRSPSHFDTNNDGKVDVNDAGHNTEQVQKETKVELFSTDNPDDYHVEKGNEAVEFVAKVSPSEVKLKQVKVGDAYYDVTPSETDQELYVFNVDPMFEVGKREVQISEVKTSNGKTLPASHTLKYEVMKTVPEIINFSHDQENHSISFEIDDVDQAFQAGTGQVRIFHEDNLEDAIVSESFEGTDKTEVNSPDLSEDRATYFVEITGSYCRVEDQSDDGHCFKDASLFSHKFMMTDNYDFQLSGFSLTDYVEPNSHPALNFVSTNSKGLTVSHARVLVDDIELEFPVTLSGDGTFLSVLEHAEKEPGKRHKVELKSVTLSDGMVFSSPNDFATSELDYFVPKDVPTVSNLTLTDVKSESKISASFHLADVNQAVSQLAVVMVDAGENIVAKTILSQDDLRNRQNFTVPLDYSVARDKAFTVKVLGDYDLGDKYNFTQVNLAEADIAVYEEGKMYVNQDLVTTADQIGNNDKVRVTRYAEKGQKNFGLAFQFYKDPNYVLKTPYSDRSYSGYSAFTINGANYNRFGVGDKLKNLGYTDAIIIGVPEESGVVDLTVSRVQFVINAYYRQASDWFSIPKIKYSFEVLRDIPKIENLRISDDYEAKTATFDFDVVVDPKAQPDDESLISGTMKWGNQEASFTRGHNSITFSDISVDQNQELNFMATFDRDSDALKAGDQDENQFENYSILKTNYGLFNPGVYQDIKIEDTHAYTNYKAENDNFFEKKEKIGLYFTLTGLPENAGRPVAATVNDHGSSTYELLQVVDEQGANIENHYAIFAEGYPEAGGRTLTITNLVFDNGKTIQINQTPPIDFEILKDKPTISDLTYRRDGANIKIQSTLNDPDKAMIGTPQVTVTDEDGTEVFRDEYSTDLSVPNNGNLHYNLQITGDYDRSAAHNNNDSNKNYHHDVALLDSMLSLSENKIELKDITDVGLYHTVDGKSNLVDEVSKNEINQDHENYFVAITMNNLSTMHIEVASAEDGNDNHLYLVLNSENFVLDSAPSTFRIGLDRKIRIDFGETSSGDKFVNKYHQDTSSADKAAFEHLLSSLRENGELKLEQDYDASGVAAPLGGYYVENYSGQLDGNGHTIKNLHGSLFKTLTGSVSNLYLENVNVQQSGKGALAHFANHANISKVIAHDVTLRGGSDESGGLIGRLDQKSTIEQSAVTSLDLNPGSVQQIGGLVGAIRDGSSIKNSYVEGQIAGPSGYLGGIAGSSNTASASTIENSYAKVALNNASISCGISCIYTGKINFRNNITLGSNYTSPISNDAEKSEFFVNNYYLVPSGKTFPERSGQTAVENASEINQDLFKKANFDSDIWRLNGSVSNDNPPKLAFEKTDQNALENQTDYDETRINAYDNLRKLSPFYQLSEIIKDGNKLNSDDLATKSIRAIVPVDAQGNLVSYLTTTDVDKIAKLRIAFSDGSHSSYDVQFDKVYDMVATYRIPELHLDYNFPHYVIDTNARIIDNLTYYLKSLNYTNNLDNLTAANDSRILRDFYANTTTNELKEFVLKYLSSTNYTPTSNNDAINAHLERTVKQDKKIEKALYAYNYFRRLYDVETDGLKFYDFTMFGLGSIDENLSTENLVNLLFSDSSSASSSMFSTGSSNGTFRSSIAKYLNMGNISQYIEYFVQNFSEQPKSMSDWVHSQFKGFLAERSIDSKPDYDSDTGLIQNESTADTGVLYTLWDHFSHPEQGQNDSNYRVYNFILPILTLPQNSSYIISTPAQFIIGNQRTYIQYRSTPGAQEAFNFRVKSYANRMKTYFATAWGLLDDKDTFNSIQVFQLDKSIAYSDDDTGFSATPRAGSTTDPHFTNFSEMTGYYPAEAGVNAGSWGSYIEFQAAGVMDATIKEVYDYQKEHGNDKVTWNENTFGTWSHETAHSIDSRLWMRNNGRRWKSGGEDYADGNLRQEFNDNLIVMNLVKDWGKDCGYASNCSPERIDSQTEIKDFYGKAFDVIDMIDYIEALAFLELTPEEMSTLAVQVSYPNATGEALTGKSKENFPDGLANDEKSRYLAYQTTKYTRNVGAEVYDDIDDIYDLYEKRIMLYPGVYDTVSRGPGSYGGEGISIGRWYYPYNDYGLPDSYSLKWRAYQMLGYAGYDDGYIEYYSNIHPIETPYTYYNNLETLTTSKDNNYKTDLSALQHITHDDTMTYDRFQTDRFRKVEEKLARLNSVVNIEDYIQQFYNALKEDYKRITTDLDAFFDWVTVHGHQYGAHSKEACLKDRWCMNGYAAYNWDGVANYLNMDSSTKVRKEIYQKLKQTTDDFRTDDIYLSDQQQDFSSVDELRTHIKERLASHEEA